MDWGSSLTMVAVTGTPPVARGYAGTAWDKARRVLYVYGGADTNMNQVYDDLWELDVVALTWNKRTEGNSPGGRALRRVQPLTRRGWAREGRCEAVHAPCGCQLGSERTREPFHGSFRGSHASMVGHAPANGHGAEEHDATAACFPQPVRASLHDIEGPHHIELERRTQVFRLRGAQRFQVDAAGTVHESAEFRRYLLSGERVRVRTIEDVGHRKVGGSSARRDERDALRMKSIGNGTTDATGCAGD